MKKFLVVVGVTLAVVLVALTGVILYFKSKANAMLAEHYTVAVEPIAVPFPLNADERAAFLKKLDAKAAAADTPADAHTADADTPQADAAAAPSTRDTTEDAQLLRAEAQRRAAARGQNYISSRAACTECHGQDFGGKIIVDSPVMGTWISPNITAGGVTAKYKPVDWVRLIRHGVKPSGLPALMPCEDFTWFSDQELSDIITYIQSVKKVDRVMPASTLGPVFAMLLSTGQFPLSAAVVDHAAPRSVLPPALEASVELGQHLATTCRGCHGANLSGGPIVGGDPAWPPAANLTFHDTGLAGYTLADFNKSLTAGVTKAGKTLDPAMPVPYTKNLKDVEREALYVYLKTLPPTTTGQR